MTIKYFYTDPLAAAWMAKHFGMRFSTTDESVVSAYEINQRFLDGTSNDNFRFYIHSDSLHLLEPQDGDLVQGDIFAKFIAKDDEEWISDGAWAFLVKTNSYCIEGEIDIKIAKKSKIIQRNGVAFHWPEVEQ